MMTCTQAGESLEARAVGLLDRDGARDVDLHLRGCAGCADLALRIASLEERLLEGDGLEREAATRVPPLRARLYSAILASPSGEPRGKMLFAAAAVALCLFVLKGILWPSVHPAAPAPETVASARPPQEPTIEDLVARLGDDRIEVRSDAMRRLIDLGPAILPRLRQVPVPKDVEARTLLSDTIRRLEELEAMVPFKSVTLNAHERSAKEVLLEVARQAGIPPTQFVFREDAGGGPRHDLPDGGDSAPGDR
jgi:hypothetical protein